MKNFRIIWKQLAKDNKLKSHHYIQRAILIAMQSTRNMSKEEIVTILLDKYFTPISNKNKLANGCTKYQAISSAYYELVYGHYILDQKLEDFFENEAEQKQYFELAKTLRIDKIDRKYVYYFTAQDMSPEHQAVQAAHAAFALGSRLGKTVNPHDTYFQWIGVKDKSNLSWLLEKYKHMNPEKFFEPDQGHSLTSFALPPIPWYARGDLVDLPLLKF